MRVAILMPVHDEGEALGRTLAEVRAASAALGGAVVFVVDDGSEPAVELGALPAASPSFEVVLARHVVNLGQGAALETARQLALADVRPEAFVTMDADGQHRAEDLGRLVAALDAGADVALGSRFLAPSRLPAGRAVLLRAARVFERAVTGLPLTDAHNGLRAFRRRAIDAVALRQNRMAHATEIRLQLARAVRERDLRVVEVAVDVRYTDATLAKGQRASGAFDILRDLFQHYLFEEAE